MSLEAYASISLHNVAETEPAEWAEGGDRLRRVPASVGERLNVSARERVRGPTASELRFVPEGDDADVRVTLSAAEPTEFHTFWGPFQPWQPTEVGPEPETFSFAVPERVQGLQAPPEEIGPFDPRVCRLRFERAPAVAVHGVEGDCRPPSEDELPDRRMLSYGTSITEGAASSYHHLSYAARTARELGWDLLNFGCSGSAYCEPAMADYLASREDWDVATLALSVNMANRGFTVEQFHERAEYFVDTVAGAHPGKPVACLTLFPYFADLVEGADAERARAFREALATIVDESPHENLVLVDGTELLDLSGLTADLLHPGDAGMEQIGRRLADRLAAIAD